MKRNKEAERKGRKGEGEERRVRTAVSADEFIYKVWSGSLY